ncbi:hypothetical protein HHX47_DHR7000332 [Lentinula edodes]|nr:hypothetical protein HHX47_DHR7000332 [Lentinula edodes]
MSEDWHSVTLKIPFASEKHALIAKQTIEVDPELQPHAVKRIITVEENVLIAYVARAIMYRHEK